MIEVLLKVNFGYTKRAEFVEVDSCHLENNETADSILDEYLPNSKITHATVYCLIINENKEYCRPIAYFKKIKLKNNGYRWALTDVDGNFNSR